MLKKFSSLWILAFLFFSICVLSVSAQQEFYIDDGRSLQKVERGNPEEIKVIEWQVRLYKVGQSKGGNNHWGLITGNSVASVMKQLKKDQDFEVRYNAWGGDGRVPNKTGTTWFNYLGPIAKIERSSASQERQDKQRLMPKDTWNKVQDAIRRADDFQQGFRAIVDILSQDPKTTTPFDNVGVNFRQYMEGIVGVMERANALRTILEDTTIPATEKILAIINEITNNFSSIQAVAPRVSQGFGISQSVLVPTSPTTPATTNSTPATTNSNSISPDKIEAEMERIMREFENIDPNDFEGSMRKINQLARQLANLINGDPTSNADMKELARLLVAITGTTDIEKMSENLERLQELMQRIKP